MALSDYERQMLEELEAQLANEDPSFAKTMKPEPAPMRRRELSLRNLVIGLVVVAAGIGVLVGGIASELTVVGVLGVVIMFLGFWYAGAGIGEPGSKLADAAARRKQPSGESFMDRQASRWQDRRDER